MHMPICTCLLAQARPRPHARSLVSLHTRSTLSVRSARLRSRPSGRARSLGCVYRSLWFGTDSKMRLRDWEPAMGKANKPSFNKDHSPKCVRLTYPLPKSKPRNCSSRISRLNRDSASVPESSHKLISGTKGMLGASTTAPDPSTPRPPSKRAQSVCSAHSQPMAVEHTHARTQTSARARAPARTHACTHARYVPFSGVSRYFWEIGGVGVWVLLAVVGSISLCGCS